MICRKLLVLVATLFCVTSLIATPAQARFLQVDPVGYQDDNNLYAYVHNDPTNKTDPTGLQPPDHMDPNRDSTSTLGEAQMQFAEEHPTAAKIIAGGASLAVGGWGGRILRGIISFFSEKPTNASADSSVQAVKLNKSLASQDQMGQQGDTIAGPGARVPFRDAPRAARDHGGKPSDWVKKSSSSHEAPDGTQFETHWVENTKTGQRVEQKTKFPEEPKPPK